MALVIYAAAGTGESQQPGEDTESEHMRLSADLNMMFVILASLY